MLGKSFSAIISSVWLMIAGRKEARRGEERREPPRPHLIKQDWKLINTGAIRKRIWQTWGTLSMVTRHWSPSSCHNILSRVSYCHTLWCQHPRWQLALCVCLHRLSHNSQLLWPLSSPLSQSGLLTADSWHASVNVSLNHSYSFPLLKMHFACGNHRRVFLPQERSLWTGPYLLH